MKYLLIALTLAVASPAFAQTAGQLPQERRYSEIWNGEWLFTIFDGWCYALGQKPTTEPINRAGDHVFGYCRPYDDDEAQPRSDADPQATAPAVEAQQASTTTDDPDEPGEPDEDGDKHGKGRGEHGEQGHTGSPGKGHAKRGES